MDQNNIVPLRMRKSLDIKLAEVIYGAAGLPLACCHLSIRHLLQNRDNPMRYLHTMVRVKDLDQALQFYCTLFGLQEIRRHENEKGRFTLVFLAAPGDLERAKAEVSPCLELTYNWDTEDYTGGRNFGHLAYEVDDIYSFCKHLMDNARDDQPTTPRRSHGLRPLAGRHFDRDSAEGRAPVGTGALGLDGQHRQLVSLAQPGAPIVRTCDRYCMVSSIGDDPRTNSCSASKWYSEPCASERAAL
ncbi:lactoylglutathione lyase [Sinorhizobium fredii]